MNPSLRKTLYWVPRIASILFILFISLFALDIFDMQLGFWETLAGLFMHLLPSFALAIGVALAWRWEWVGAVLYTGFAAWYIYVSAGRGFPVSVYLLLAGIPFLVGVLFAAGWAYRQQIRPAG